MGRIVNCVVRGVEVLLDIDDIESDDVIRNYEVWRAETFSTKEPDTLGWIDAHFRPGDVIYDIGANIGQYSLYAARKLDRECRILAFEPESLNYAKLNRNIVLNELTETITAYCLAVTESREFGHFYVQRFAPGAALHSWGRPVTQGERPFQPQNRQGMIGMSLDDLTIASGLPFPNHVKIDVDGIEEEIVRGASRTLADERLRTALVEVYMFRDIAESIEVMFQETGFRLSNDDEIDRTEGLAQNLIFVR